MFNQLSSHQPSFKLVSLNNLSSQTSINHTKENLDSNMSHSKENMLIMNQLPRLNMSQSLDNMLIMKPSKKLN